MDDTQLRQEINELHAELCSALSDPNRILILYRLAEKSHNVTDLAEAIGTSQPSTSRHLKQLRDQGLVRAVRRGSSVEYRLNDYRLIDALEILRAILRDRLAHRASLIGEE